MDGVEGQPLQVIDRRAGAQCATISLKALEDDGVTRLHRQGRGEAIVEPEVVCAGEYVHLPTRTGRDHAAPFAHHPPRAGPSFDG
jgi:hypothetical protein